MWLKMTEKSSPAGRPWVIVAAYVLLLFASIVIYACFPLSREHLKFWIPQIFVLILIVVTTLYVLHTANLVEETRRLQQRPLIRIRFCEIDHPENEILGELYSSGQQLLRGVASRVSGNETPLQTRCIALEVKNIGQATARDITIRVTCATPSGSLSQEKLLGCEIEKDLDARVTIVPAALPWIRIYVHSVIYGDGLRKYSEFTGKNEFVVAIEEIKPIPS